jgi:hypothetical protein
MRIALVLDYHDLERMAKLFQLLYDHFPDGWISFERHGNLQPAIHPILWLKTEDLETGDKAFLDSLKGPLVTLPNPDPHHDVIRYYEIVPTKADSDAPRASP